MNLYYNPEKFGLALVGEIDWGSNNGDDISCVWKSSVTNSSLLFMGSDSTCSCYSPFTDQGLDDLTIITSLKQLQEHLHQAASDKYDPVRAAELVERVAKLGIR